MQILIAKSQEPHIVLTHNCLQTLRVASCLQIKLFILDLFRDVPISWPGSVGQRKQEAAHSEIFALDLFWPLTPVSHHRVIIRPGGKNRSENSCHQVTMMA